MKFVKLGLSMLPILSFGTKAVPSIKNGPQIDIAALQGPFDGTENATCNILIIRCKGGETFKVTYRNAKTNAIVIGENYQVGETVHALTLNYILKLKDRLTDSGLIITFALYEGSNPVISTEIKLYPKQAQTINAFDYIYQPYEISNRTFYITLNKVRGTKESFQFKNTFDTLYVNSGSYIDFSELFFTYSFDKPLTNLTDGFYLKIRDVHNVFSNIKKESDSTFKIPFELVQNGTDIYLKPAHKFYVNNEDLTLSLIEKDGYEETNNFYIDRSKIDKFEKGDFTFVLENIGYNETTINIPLKIEDGAKVIGFCYDSTYCFSGGVKE